MRHSSRETFQACAIVMLVDMAGEADPVFTLAPIPLITAKSDFRKIKIGQIHAALAMRKAMRRSEYAARF